MEEFDWDKWNTDKNWIKHKVTYRECEEVFFNRHRFTYKDIKHSVYEERYGILGQTTGGRKLHINFTVKGNKIRVISARDMNRKERKTYEEKRQKNK